MQVILPDEQIHQIQLLLSNLIQKEIKQQLEKNPLSCPYFNKQQTFDSWIQKGLPSIKIGKTIRFHKDSIDCWLNGNN